MFLGTMVLIGVADAIMYDDILDVPSNRSLQGQPVMAGEAGDDG